jgi:hypothetical protein
MNSEFANQSVLRVRFANCPFVTLHSVECVSEPPPRIDYFVVWLDVWLAKKRVCGRSNPLILVELIGLEPTTS